MAMVNRLALDGYVMAGGASTRFGFDKARAELNKESMLVRMCGLVRGVTGSVSVVAPFGRYADSGERIVDDHWPGEGPLGGIITALMDARARNHQHGWCLIVGCDMPFLTEDWLRFLVQRAEASAADVVLPVSGGRPEPLCACWRTRAAEILRRAFERGVRKVMDGASHSKVEVLDEKDWKRFDKTERLFWNMNTPSEYEEARHILETEER